MNRLDSLAWGIVAFLVGTLIDNVFGLMALGSLGVVFGLYWFHLKKKGIRPSYYIIGFFSIAVVLVFYLVVGGD